MVTLTSDSKIADFFRYAFATVNDPETAPMSRIVTIARARIEQAGGDPDKIVPNRGYQIRESLRMHVGGKLTKAKLTEFLASDDTNGVPSRTSGAPRQIPSGATQPAEEIVHFAHNEILAIVQVTRSLDSGCIKDLIDLDKLLGNGKKISMAIKIMGELIK